MKSKDRIDFEKSQKGSGYEGYFLHMTKDGKYKYPFIERMFVKFKESLTQDK